MKYWALKVAAFLLKLLAAINLIWSIIVVFLIVAEGNRFMSSVNSMGLGEFTPLLTSGLDVVSAVTGMALFAALIRSFVISVLLYGAAHFFELMIDVADDIHAMRQRGQYELISRPARDLAPDGYKPNPTWESSKVTSRKSTYSDSR
jgi:hypothetical protein